VTPERTVVFFKATEFPDGPDSEPEQFFHGFAELARETAAEVICLNVQIPRIHVEVADGEVRSEVRAEKLGRQTFAKDRFAVFVHKADRPPWFSNE